MKPNLTINLQETLAETIRTFASVPNLESDVRLHILELQESATLESAYKSYVYYDTHLSRITECLTLVGSHPEAKELIEVQKYCQRQVDKLKPLITKPHEHEGLIPERMQEWLRICDLIDFYCFPNLLSLIPKYIKEYRKLDSKVNAETDTKQIRKFILKKGTAHEN